MPGRHAVEGGAEHVAVDLGDHVLLAALYDAELHLRGG